MIDNEIFWRRIRGLEAAAIDIRVSLDTLHERWTGVPDVVATLEEFRAGFATLEAKIGQLTSRVDYQLTEIDRHYRSLVDLRDRVAVLESLSERALP